LGEVSEFKENGVEFIVPTALCRILPTSAHVRDSKLNRLRDISQTWAFPDTKADFVSF